jgi:hypothetical protein
MVRKKAEEMSSGCDLADGGLEMVVMRLRQMKKNRSKFMAIIR